MTMWRGLLLGLAAAAVSVPTAQARHPDNERARPTVAGRTNGYATYYRALDLVSQGLNRLVLTTASSPDDRPGVRGPLSRPVVVSARSTPFDWRYAGIGIGSALVVIALFTGSLGVGITRTISSRHVDRRGLHRRSLLDSMSLATRSAERPSNPRG